jgi:transposase-like protein
MCVLAPEAEGSPAEHWSRSRRGRFSERKAAVKVGIAGHEARHTAASRAIRSGANIKVVQAIMDASATMTRDRYGHLYDDVLDDVADVADRLDADRADVLRTSLGQSARWFVDETYVKVAGRWTYLYRALDQHGQIVDVWLSARRDLRAAREFFIRALATGCVPVEVTTDRAPSYPRVLDELFPGVLHDTSQYANNRVEADHGRLKARLRPMRSIKTPRGLGTVARGHAFVQNLRRGHYEIATEAAAQHRLRVGFDELTPAI